MNNVLEMVNRKQLTMEDQETNLRIEAAFGPRVWDYTIVLFTYGDRLEGKSINDVIASSDADRKSTRLNSSH